MTIKARPRVRYQIQRFIITAVWLAASLPGLLVAMATPAEAACSALPSSLGTLTETLSVPATGTYRVWARESAAAANQGSFYLQIDNTYCSLSMGGGAIAANALTWIDYQNGTTSSVVNVSLSAGSHTIIMAGNSPNLIVDKLLFASDLTCTPTGDGSNCNGVSSTPTPTAAPAPSATVSLTGVSAGQTVSGNITVAAVPSSGASVSKVEFFVDGTSIRVDTSAPFCFGGGSGTCYPYDTHQLSNGDHAIKAVMTYAGGTAQISDLIRVANSAVADKTAPAQVGGLKAAAPTPAQINLTWNAAADNTGGSGVSKYNIYRVGTSGVFATSLLTSYTDSRVSANSNYSYTVAAVDASGNVGPQSAAVSIKTPVATDTTKPTAPGNLRVAAVTSNSVALAWNASTDNVGVLGYHVYRNTTYLGDTTTTSYTDTGLKSATDYPYHVVAYDASANGSASSNAITAHTLKIVVVGSQSAPIIVKGTIALAPPPSNKAVVDTTYKVDGKTLTTPTLDTTKLSDGTHEVEVTTQNADGTTTSSYQKIEVKNHPKTALGTIVAAFGGGAVYIIVLIVLVALGVGGYFLNRRFAVLDMLHLHHFKSSVSGVDTTAPVSIDRDAPPAANLIYPGNTTPVEPAPAPIDSSLPPAPPQA